MKILNIDYDFFKYPDGINSIDEFIDYLEDSDSYFIKLTQLVADNCRFPYFVEEDVKELYLGIPNITKIIEVQATILPRAEYEERLKKIVAEKCVHCENYTEDCEGDNLKGHRDTITLDGDCYIFREKK